MSASLLPDKLAVIQQLAFSLLQNQHVTVCRVMSFLGKTNFCTNGHSQLWHLCCVIQSDMLTVYHSSTHLFSHVHFFLSSLCQLEQLSHLQQSPVPLQFPLPDVVIATEAMPTHWAFYFQGFSLPLLVIGSWSGSMCRAHIALQELQAIGMMLCRMAFHLSGKVVALHLDNSTAKAYLCNQGGTVSPFLSRLACWILSLSNKHGITLIPAYIPTHFNVEPIICPGIGCFQSGIFSLRWLKQLFTFGAFQRWTYWDLLIPLNASIITPWNCHYLWGHLWVECLQPSLDISGKLYIFSSCISSSSSVQVPGRTCQRSTEMFDSGGTMLDGGSLAPHISQHVGRHSSVVSYHKWSCHGYLDRPGAQGSAISAFNPMAAQRCVLCRQGFSCSVCQAVVGATWVSMSKVYQQCWKEWAGWCAQQGVLNNAISAPKLANFLVHLFQVGLVWHTIRIYHSAVSTFLGLIIFTRLLIILLFQN